MRRRTFCAVLVAALLSMSTTLCAQIEFENLTAGVGRGFGSTWNRYAWAIGELNGKTYVGTWSTQPDYIELGNAVADGSFFSTLGNLIGGNPLESIGVLASDGAEIWRHDGGQSWTRVYKATPETSGFRKAVTHNNKLFMGALNSSQGTRVLYSSDGTNWNDLAGGPLENPDNISVRTMLSQGGLLYVGTENNVTGGELWAYDDAAKSWTHVQTFTDPSVAELAVWKDRIAVGTWDFADSYNFYIKQPDGQWKKATPVFPGSEALDNVGVMKLIVFKERMYLGTANFNDGFTLLRSAEPDKPDSWEVLSTDGFGNPDSRYVWTLVEWDNKLVLGTFTLGVQGGIASILPTVGSAELFCSEDGVVWDDIPGDYNTIFTYGIRNAFVTQNGELLIATATNAFLPDLGSSLYTPLFIEIFGSSLIAQAAQAAFERVHRDGHRPESRQTVAGVRGLSGGQAAPSPTSPFAL